MRRSSEREFRVEWHAVFFQQGEKFRVEVHFSMMCFLILDVADDGGNQRRAYAEHRVAFLSSKLVALSARPARGIRFDCENLFGLRQ